MTSERRRYYRIDEEVLISARPVEKAQTDDWLENFWANEHAFSIRNNYNFQIEQHIGDRHKIARQFPELARFLAVLETQIDRLTEMCIQDENEQDMTRKLVSLSASGIAYCDDLVPAQDELVELQLKLLPSGMRLVTIARVVLVEAESDQGKNRISLDFEHLHEADREILIKHIHGKQMDSLRNTEET